MYSTLKGKHNFIPLHIADDLKFSARERERQRIFRPNKAHQLALAGMSF